MIVDNPDYNRDFNSGMGAYDTHIADEVVMGGVWKLAGYAIGALLLWSLINARKRG